MNYAAAPLDARLAEQGLTPRPFEVRGARRELDDVITLELEAADGAPLAFEPGQFTMLYLHGIGEIPISISGDPARSEVLVQTVRGVGAVSEACCRLQAGDRVGVRGPFGRPWPIAEAEGKHLLVMAGGLGLAPTRPIVYWGLANRDRIKGLHIVYGARTPDAMLYAAQLLGWAAAEGVSVAVTVDRHSADWAGHVGVVTDLVKDLRFDPAEGVAMLCGPEVMMRFSLQALQAWGMKDSQVHVTMERNMKCGIGWCGHCQLGPYLICRDGPVFAAPEVRQLMGVWEL